MGSATSKQQNVQVAPAEMQSWANKNYPAVAEVLRDHCRRDGIDKVEVLFPKGAKSGDEFRLDVSKKGESVNSFVVTISKDVSGAEAVHVKPLAEADKETREQWGKDKSSFQVIPRAVEQGRRVEQAYNSTCVQEGDFTTIIRKSGPSDKASEVFYYGNTITNVSLSVQGELKDNKVYADAVGKTSEVLNGLFNSVENLKTSYVAEYPSDIQKNPVLYNLVSTLAGPKNSHNFAVVKAGANNADFLIPGKNAENIQEGVTTAYFLMPMYRADKDKENTMPTGSAIKTLDYIPQEALRLKVVPDQENKNMVNFVLDGKVVASQDRSTAGVPSDIIKMNQSEYQIVPAVKVFSYHLKDDSSINGTVLGSAIAKFDGKTNLEVTNTFTGNATSVKPAAGEYRVFTADVLGEKGEVETKVVAIQSIKTATLPKNIVKEADHLTLDATSVFNQLDMKNAHLTVITVPSSNVKTPEIAVEQEKTGLQSYLSDVGGAIKNILPTEANFNFNPSTRNIESLKPEALEFTVIPEVKKTGYTLSP